MAIAAVASESIGTYQIIRQLGSGAMGEVYLAHDPNLGRDVALKVLPRQVAQEPEQMARLKHEARTASALNHSNIVTIYEIGRDGFEAFIAMEYVDGQTLREMLAGGPLTVKKSLQIAGQLADGLAAAHKRELIHRDLKPENIMVTADGVVKILDFGLAKSSSPADAQRVQSDPGTIVGTYAYMSPEQARAGNVDYRSDQFALGAILYEMLTGNRAFEGASGVETLFMVVRDEPPALSRIAAHVPAPVRWIVDRCLSKDPEERYASTRDVARDLMYLRDHFSEAGMLTPIGDEKPGPTKMRRNGVIAAIVIGALAIGAAGTALLRRPAPRTITSEHYLTYSGRDYSPAVSPDGKLIAFSSNRDGTLRIWIKQMLGGSEVSLTSGPDDLPRFSPDGSTILFSRGDPIGGAASLFSVPVVGGEARRVIDNAVSGDWSPDGKSIAFTRNDPAVPGRTTSALFTCNSDGSGVRELTKTAVGALQPRWSPDQKWVAVILAPGRVAQLILLVDSKTGKSHYLTTPPKSGEISSVVWSADSKSIFYIRAESVEATVGSSGQIVRHDITADKTEVIGWASHNGTELDALANGKVVMDVRSPRDNLREISIGTSAAAEKWVTLGNSSDRQPVYSPDGKSVLFSSNRSGNLDLWVISTDGGTVRRITDDAAEDWDPAFTPDGKSIVWSSGRSGHLEIWTANSDGSNARQLSHDQADSENPSATADGKWIVYNSFNGDAKTGVCRIHPDGTGSAMVVTGRTAVPEVSPDGQYVAYISDGRTRNSSIRVARIADGADMNFAIPIRAKRRTAAIIGRPRWVQGGKAIAFLGQNDDGINGIFVQDFVPGQDTKATRKALGGFDRERATESFGISPDGQTMTVAGWEQLFSIFSIDGVTDVTMRRNDKKENS